MSKRVAKRRSGDGVPEPSHLSGSSENGPAIRREGNLGADFVMIQRTTKRLLRFRVPYLTVSTRAHDPLRAVRTECQTNGATLVFQTRSEGCAGVAVPELHLGAFDPRQHNPAVRMSRDVQTLRVRIH